MRNLDHVRSMTPAQLKDWYCAGRACGTCPYGQTPICGFLLWLHSAVREEEQETQPWKDEMIEVLRLQPRIQRTLFDIGIYTLGQLYAMRLYDMKSQKGIGEVAAAEVSKSFFQYTGQKMRK